MGTCSSMKQPAKKDFRGQAPSTMEAVQMVRDQAGAPRGWRASTAPGRLQGVNCGRKGPRTVPGDGCSHSGSLRAQDLCLNLHSHTLAKLETPGLRAKGHGQTGWEGLH